jgi:Ca2+/Na+ antiporter
MLVFVALFSSLNDSEFYQIKMTFRFKKNQEIGSTLKFLLLLMYLFSFFLYSSAVYNQGHILYLCFYINYTIKRGNSSLGPQQLETHFKLKRNQSLIYTMSAYVASLDYI